jgi:hypothetical protein
MANFVKAGYNYQLKKGDYLLDFIDPKKHTHLKTIYSKVFTG